MTADARQLLALVVDELRAIALQIETLEAALDARSDEYPLTGGFLAWRLAAYYRMETELKETRATLLAQEDA